MKACYNSEECALKDCTFCQAQQNEEDEYEEDDVLTEEDIDEIHDMWHPNETQEEFAEHENFDD